MNSRPVWATYPDPVSKKQKKTYRNKFPISVINMYGKYVLIKNMKKS